MKACDYLNFTFVSLECKAIPWLCVAQRLTNLANIPSLKGSLVGQHARPKEILRGVRAWKCA